MNPSVAHADLHRFSFRHDARNARNRWAERSGVVLRVCDRDGCFGYGEASPLPGYSRDSLAQCEHELARFAAAAPMTGREGALFEAIFGVFRDLRIESPAARFAIETAWLDLAARTRGVPLWALLRSEVHGANLHVPNADLHVPSASPVDFAAMIDDPGEAASRVRAAWDRGIRTLKVKVGRPGELERELEALRAIRAAHAGDAGHAGHGAHGTDVLRLRADANGVWEPSEARVRLEELRAFELEFIEEPCAPAGWAALAGCGVPIAADESLQTPGGVDFALERAHEGVCRVFVLKASALGGAFACMHLAGLARRAGAEVVITHMFEGPIGHAASIELALALEPAPLACGLDFQPFASAWPPAMLVRASAHSAMPTTSIGLGIASHWMQSVPPASP